MTAKLAAHGGPKVRDEPLVRPEHARARFGEEERRALAEVMDSGHLCSVTGERTRAFERRVADCFGAAGAAAVTSGTAAIHCALAAVGVGPGDEVVTSPITDMGSVIPILALSAVPVFADVDPETWNITAETIAQVLTPRTTAIIVVHLAGQSCVMAPILDLAGERGLKVIEDCAQSYLGTCNGRPVGTMGDAGCFSLNDYKHISCGDGGFVISKDLGVVSRARLFADKGYDRTGPARDSLVFGMNYRMTELQAAVASVQIEKVDGIVRRRREFAALLSGLLEGIEAVRRPRVAPGVEHSWWFYPFTVDLDAVGTDAATFAGEVTAEGIPVTFPYLAKPVYLFRTMQSGKHPVEATYRKGLCPDAEKALGEMMVLPCTEFLSERDAWDIATALRKVCEYHTG